MARMLAIIRILLPTEAKCLSSVSATSLSLLLWKKSYDGVYERQRNTRTAFHGVPGNKLRIPAASNGARTRNLVDVLTRARGCFHLFASVLYPREGCSDRCIC